MEKHTVGNYVVTTHQDTDYDYDYDFESGEDSFGIDMSNHRDFRSPTYGKDMPVTMSDYTDWVNGDKESCEDNMGCRRFEQTHYILPVFMYDHSGRTIRTTPFSCRWDSGQTGWVYVNKVKFSKSTLYGVKPSMAADQRQKLGYEFLRSMVTEIDNVMTGNVWGYNVETQEGRFIDSCWGFVGDEDCCLKEGIAEATHHLSIDRKSRIKKLKQMIKFRSPLHVRAGIVGARP